MSSLRVQEKFNIEFYAEFYLSLPWRKIFFKRRILRTFNL